MSGRATEPDLVTGAFSNSGSRIAELLIESGGDWHVLLTEPGQELPSVLVAAATPKGRLIARIADTA